MGMTLRVVVPPHPLIAHWLTLLRDRSTPAPLFATAMTELGRWLTYEALRDWLPQRPVEVDTPLSRTGGMVVDARIPLLAVPVLRGGLGLWQGAQAVLPAAAVSHVGVTTGAPGGEAHWYLDDLPASIGSNVGILVFLPVLASGATLLAVIERLRERGVEAGDRLRVITTVASAPGLREVGEREAHLTIYCSCIDPELDERRRVLPGFGDAALRLYGLEASSS